MRKLLLLVALLCLPVAPVLAQDYRYDERYDGDEDRGPEQGDVEVTLSASGVNDDSFDSGAFSLAGSLGVFLTNGFELGARHNMNFFDSDEVDATYIATTRAFADYNFDFDWVVPFVGANVGIRYGDNVDETGTLAPEAGVKFFALEDTFLFGMGEYQWFFEDVDDADDNFDDGQFVYTVGIGFLF